MSERMPLDRDKVMLLTQKLFVTVRVELRRPPFTGERCAEMLNALATVTAVVLAGTDFDAEARRLFDDALERQLEALSIQEPEG